MGIVYLVIDEREAEDIGKNQDDLLLRIISRGGRNITFDASDLLDLSCNVFVILMSAAHEMCRPDTNGNPPSATPSWMTPAHFSQNEPGYGLCDDVGVPVKHSWQLMTKSDAEVVGAALYESRWRRRYMAFELGRLRSLSQGVCLYGAENLRPILLLMRRVKV